MTPEEQIKKLNAELTARKILDRLSVKPGCQQEAATLAMGVSENVPHDDKLQIDEVARGLERSSPAVFEKQVQKIDPASQTPEERKAYLRSKGIL